jgi:hypothetical protein
MTNEQQPPTQHTKKLHQWHGPIADVWNFWCPACKCGHGFTVYHPPDAGKGWQFNGNVDKPTFTPSLRYLNQDGKTTMCHLNMTDGMLIFHGDCPHDFKGRVVPMEDL